ncbi:hypothetical protein [Microbulbifer pacificus]|uniref:Uncharacterized protein n=1 Tax=Microbulbifer pacificus TaxID=407164 RepID=A0AAU0MYC1_9GAMM|nr:hypothetical protein [Microbulbifer pacificus]WOX04829.1 hypothetical protein R5R33_13925 [Microbulbifer pacificus]
MKKAALGIALAAGMLSSVAFADVAQYIKDGYTMDQVIALAQSEGISTVEAVRQAIIAAPEKAADIVTAAIDAGADPEQVVATAVAAAKDKAEEIVTAAVAAGADEQVVAQAAIANGADPAVVAQATAAGRKAFAGRGPGSRKPLPPIDFGVGGGHGGGKGKRVSDN